MNLRPEKHPENAPSGKRTWQCPISGLGDPHEIGTEHKLQAGLFRGSCAETSKRSVKHLERRDEKTDTQEPRCLPGHVAKESRSSAKERASPASAATNTEKLKPPGLANSHGETQPRKGVGASELNLPSYI